MVWRADNDGVDILLHFVEHDTIVVKLRHFGELTEALCTSFFIDVTQGNDILVGDSQPKMNGLKLLRSWWRSMTGRDA